MPKTLPDAWSLITGAWNDFLKHWNETFQVSVWFLYFGLVSFAGSLLVKLSSSVFFAMTQGILEVLVAVGSIWAGIRLMQVVLEVESGKKPTLDAAATNRAARLILPILGIAILQAIVVLGGFLLFILPGIYLAVCLAFTQLTRIEGEHKGFQALAASRNLVNGRWWGVLWRLFAGNLVFGLAIGLAMSLVLGLLATVSGDAFVTGNLSESADPLVRGAVNLLQSASQAAVMPLFVFFQVKLYRALKATQ